MLSVAVIVVALLLAGPSTAQQKQAKPAEALKTMMKAEVRPLVLNSVFELCAVIFLRNAEQELCSALQQKCVLGLV
jgi:hypothetical protein